MLSVRKTVLSMLSKTLSEQLSNLLSLMLSTCFICVIWMLSVLLSIVLFVTCLLSDMLSKLLSVTLPESMGTIAFFTHVDKVLFCWNISFNNIRRIIDFFPVLSAAKKRKSSVLGESFSPEVKRIQLSPSPLSLESPFKS